MYKSKPTVKREQYNWMAEKNLDGIEEEISFDSIGLNKFFAFTWCNILGPPHVEVAMNNETTRHKISVDLTFWLPEKPWDFCADKAQKNDPISKQF